jgi:hypothetical protein
MYVCLECDYLCNGKTVKVIAVCEMPNNELRKCLLSELELGMFLYTFLFWSQSGPFQDPEAKFSFLCSAS